MLGFGSRSITKYRIPLAEPDQNHTSPWVFIQRVQPCELRSGAYQPLPAANPICEENTSSSSEEADKLSGSAFNAIRCTNAFKIRVSSGTGRLGLSTLSTQCVIFSGAIGTGTEIVSRP